MRKVTSVVAVITASQNGTLDRGCYNIVTVSRRGNYNDIGLPGGKVEGDESLLSAISREILEETGLILGPLTKRNKTLPMRYAECGEHYVAIFAFDLSDFENELSRLTDLSIGYVSNEDCFVKISYINETFTRNNSFAEFNIMVKDLCVRKGIMPWLIPDDIDLGTLAGALDGKHDTIEETLTYYSAGNLEVEDYDGDLLDDLLQLEYLSTCDFCGVWQQGDFDYVDGSDVCHDCATQYYNDDTDEEYEDLDDDYEGVDG